MFIGLRINVAAAPCKTSTRWMLWDEKVRARLAAQLQAIRHWRIHHGSYRLADNLAGPATTFFLDPPYQQKQFYRDKIDDYTALAAWVRSLPGQVIVCEGPGADWLPFETLTRVKTHPNAKAGTVDELIYVQP